MKQAVILFFATLFVYGLTAGGHLYSPDEEILFRTSRAIIDGHTLAIEPMTGFATRPALPPRPDGREYAQYGAGQPLAAAPLVWLGEKLADCASAETWRKLYGAEELTGRLGFDPASAEIAPRFAVSWFNIVIGALMAAFVYLLCLEITGLTMASVWAAALYAFGSLAWPHSRPFFTESFAALCMVVAWWAVMKSLSRRICFWMMLGGLAAGYAALVRMDSVLAYPGLAVMMFGPVLDASRRQRIPVVVAWACFAIPAALCGALLLWLNWRHFGGALKTGYADQPEGIAFATPVISGLFGFLFSVGKGLFFFSPALAPGLWGWGAMRRGEKQSWWLIAALALAILVPLGVQATWQNWPGGWCWGPRHIFLIHPFLAIPVACWLAEGWGPVKRTVAIAMLLVGASVQMLGCSQDFIAFHYRFFRSPGDATAFYVHYDPMDEAYWRQYFQVLYRDPSTGAQRPLPTLVLPPPIQDSVYHPQRSVWLGYPRMAREGEFDNIWRRALAGSPALPAPAGEARP